MNTTTPTVADTDATGTDLAALTLTDANLAIGQPREWVHAGLDEQFRRIYTYAWPGAAEVLAISSAQPGEGKSTVALGMAVTIAQDMPHRRVLLVETNLRNPVFADDFAFEPGPGLVDCLLADELVEVGYRSTFLNNLQILPVGGPAQTTERLLRSNAMLAAFDDMRETHDLIILDTAALLASSDTILLSDIADALLMVVRTGVTPTAEVNQALGMIDMTKMRGIVLNGSRSAVPGWLRRLCGF